LRAKFQPPQVAYIRYITNDGSLLLRPFKIWQVREGSFDIHYFGKSDGEVKKVHESSLVSQSEAVALLLGEIPDHD